VGANAAAANREHVLGMACTRGANSTISLNAGPNFGTGLAGFRAMTTGAARRNTLSYELFQPTAIGGSASSSGTPWGDGIVGGNAFTVPVSTGVAAGASLVSAPSRAAGRLDGRLRGQRNRDGQTSSEPRSSPARARSVLLAAARAQGAGLNVSPVNST